MLLPLMLACTPTPTPASPTDLPTPDTATDTDTDLPSTVESWMLTAPPAPTTGSFVGTSPEIRLHLHTEDGSGQAALTFTDLGSERTYWADITTDRTAHTLEVQFEQFEPLGRDIALTTMTLTAAGNGLEGHASLTGTLFWPEGTEEVGWTATFTGVRDTSAGLAYYPGRFDAAIWPWAETLFFSAREPIPGLADVSASLDTTPWPSHILPIGPAGSAIGVEVTPGWMPWGSALSLDPDLDDQAGNPVMSPTPVQVEPAPPAQATSDGFEGGLGGWRASPLVTAASFGDVISPEGASVAYVPSGEHLVGSFDVGSTDSSLTFSAASAGSSFCSVRIYAPDVPGQVVWSSSDPHTAPTNACTGCPDTIDMVSDFQALTVDLTPYRDGPAVVFASCTPRFGPVGPYGLLLDDFSVQ